MIEARFDDLTPGGESFRLVDPIGVLEATRPDEVAPVVAAAEAAAQRGLWVAGAVAYEAAPGLDPRLTVRPRASDDAFARLPFAWFAMFERRETTLLPDPPDSPSVGQEQAWRPSVSRETYDDAIARIREHIASGDTYQVNHTLRLRSRLAGDPRGLYRDMCFAQKGAHSAYLDMGRYRVLSASPELFFRISGNRLTTKPMKGTAPRGLWPQQDEEIAARLRGSIKDQAENAMIVDLLRNDLGRIARIGTVSWTDVFEPERFETVWQLTSTVSAELRADVDLAAVFAALFPSGSVTGAPKVRTMQITAALEDSPRGIYCGAVGFLSPAESGLPSAQFNVAIRTVTVDTETQTAEYGVGGGITWNSRAGDEYAEIVAKSKVLIARRPRFELLETLRHDPGVGFRRLDLHLRRLEASAAYFGYLYEPAPVLEALEREAARFPDRPSRIRLTLDRRGVIRTGGIPLSSAFEPVRIALDLQHPVEQDDVFVYHKTTLRGRYEQAKARHPDADDVLMINSRGELTETTVANVAVKLNGRWYTPPISAGALPGVERAALLSDGTLEERAVHADELRNRGGLAIFNSVRGWRAAELID